MFKSPFFWTIYRHHYKTRTAQKHLGLPAAQLCLLRTWAGLTSHQLNCNSPYLIKLQVSLSQYFQFRGPRSGISSGSLSNCGIWYLSRISSKVLNLIR